MICSGIVITYITVFKISRPSLPEPQARLGLVRIKAPLWEQEGSILPKTGNIEIEDLQILVDHLSSVDLIAL
jgi:hypothetical protein